MHGCQGMMVSKDRNPETVLDDKKLNGQHNYMECIVLD